MMRISNAGLLLAAASMLVGCVSESAIFRSPDGKNFLREGYVGGPAPAPPPAIPPSPAVEPAPSR
jgi:hypothetical protein